MPLSFRHGASPWSRLPPLSRYGVGRGTEGNSSLTNPMPRRNTHAAITHRHRLTIWLNLGAYTLYRHKRGLCRVRGSPVCTAACAQRANYQNDGGDRSVSKARRAATRTRHGASSRTNSPSPHRDDGMVSSNRRAADGSVQEPFEMVRHELHPYGIRHAAGLLPTSAMPSTLTHLSATAHKALQYRLPGQSQRGENQIFLGSTLCPGAAALPIHRMHFPGPWTYMGPA